MPQPPERQPVCREATARDIDLLIELMAEFYAEAGYTIHTPRVQAAFSQLLADPSLGRVWLIHDAGAAAGYLVLTLGYSMEYGGRDAFIDDLFLRPEFRGRGIGRRALEEVRVACTELGVRAVHLEVGRDNTAARALYRTFGFTDNDRQLLTLRLAEPSHLL